VKGIPEKNGRAKVFAGIEEFHHFNLFDLFLLVLIAFSAILGIYRGFVRESLGLVAWCSAFFLASQKGYWVTHWLAPWIKKPALLSTASSLIVFLLALVTLLTIVQMISAWIKQSLIGGLDRFLGLFFSVLRSVFLMTVVYGVVLHVVPFAQHPPIVRKSLSAPLLAQWSVYVGEWVPVDWVVKNVDIKKIENLTGDVLSQDPKKPGVTKKEGIVDKKS
jgi:membrane protein required for colicin V production